MLTDCRTIVTADRVLLGCYGVAGGQAGLPFLVTVDPEEEKRKLSGLVDGAPVPKGRIVQIETTGGGGWGDALTREPERVLLDVVQGKVSPKSAREDYGVALTRDGSTFGFALEAAATEALRASLRAQRKTPLPVIDRGISDALLPA